MGILYVVATPIGNLEDITSRALCVLKEADFVLCEDTRVTKKLLGYYGIKTPSLSYHQHSKPEKMEYIFELLSKGKNLALVTDAGTPGISDPGNELISFLLAREDLRLKSARADFKRIAIIPVPGPSALTALASIAGFPMDKFLFLGYPPHKNKRKKFFEEIAESKYPVLFYESPYRIIKSLSELRTILHTKYRILETRIVAGRELTKKFETVHRGSLDAVVDEISHAVSKGEWTVVVWRVDKGNQGE